MMTGGAGRAHLRVHSRTGMWDFAAGVEQRRSKASKVAEEPLAVLGAEESRSAALGASGRHTVLYCIVYRSDEICFS